MGQKAPPCTSQRREGLFGHEAVCLVYMDFDVCVCSECSDPLSSSGLVLSYMAGLPSV